MDRSELPDLPPHSPLFPPSGADRWMRCAPSVELSIGMPDTPSEAAEEGTIAHDVTYNLVSHRLGREGFDQQYLTQQLDRLDDTYKEAITSAVDLTLRWIAAAERHGHRVWREGKVYATHIHPLLYGSCDLAIATDTTLLVLDYKFGAGYVVHTDSWQMRIYALAILKVMGWRFKTVQVHILQERADYLKDTPTHRTQDYDLMELLEFEAELRQRTEYIQAKLDDPRPIDQKYDAADYQVGDHCRYCLGAIRCKAAQHAVRDFALLKTMDGSLDNFSTVEDAMAHVEGLLQAETAVARGIEIAKTLALKYLENGGNLEHYSLTDKLANRSWILTPEELEAKLAGTGVDVYSKKGVLSPNQLQTQLRNAGLDIDVDDWTMRKQNGHKLVPKRRDHAAKEISRGMQNAAELEALKLNLAKAKR